MFNAFYAKTIILCAVFLTTTLLLIACKAPTGNAENGKRWFNMHNCYACHGNTANNGRAPKIANLNRSYGSFVRFLRTPGSASMPNFPEEQISKQETADIYAWLKSLPE